MTRLNFSGPVTRDHPGKKTGKKWDGTGLLSTQRVSYRRIATRRGNIKFKNSLIKAMLKRIKHYLLTYYFPISNKKGRSQSQMAGLAGTGKGNFPNNRDDTLPGFVQKYQVPGKWHSGTQTSKNF